MPETDVIFFADADGSAPALIWLGAQPEKIQDKFEWLIENVLARQGHAARRPHAAPLADGIYELRAQLINVHYRLLYFFDGAAVIVIAHGCSKKSSVDPADIERAKRSRARYLKDREAHTYNEPD